MLSVVNKIFPSLWEAYPFSFSLSVTKEICSASASLWTCLIQIKSFLHYFSLAFFLAAWSICKFVPLSDSCATHSNIAVLSSTDHRPQGCVSSQCLILLRPSPLCLLMVSPSLLLPHCLSPRSLCPSLSVTLWIFFASLLRNGTQGTRAL